MAHVDDGKEICDCRICGELPIPKRLTQRQIRTHRKKYGFNGRSSFSSIEVPGDGPLMPQRNQIASTLQRDTESDPVERFQASADGIRNDILNERFPQQDRSSSEGEDEEIEADIRQDSETDLDMGQIPELDEAIERLDGEQEFTDEDTNPALGGVPLLRGLDELNDEEEFEIKRLMSFTSMLQITLSLM